ncbi:MAG: FtsQ-type POTRA domain-containing protein [Kiritimatiellae bacterium]|nr:FtsQ-type POTRA domain-containing protein [Kiritimatiellia bacterium]
MMKNTKRKATLHSALRQNSIAKAGRKGPLVWTVLGVLAAALVAGGWIGYVKLRELWIEQCVVTDVARQVSVTTGANIKSGLILESFGLRNGANLALIDFAAKRREILERIPNIRSLSVARHLPDRVEITVVEREPVAKMNVKGGKSVTGRVADADGVVFVRQTGTNLLPTIVEAKSPYTKAGQTLSGRPRAALALVTACQESDFSELHVQSVDATRADFLYAVLGNWSFAKIAWEGMDDPPSEASSAAMRRQLAALRDSKRTPGGSAVKIWNVTIPGKAYGDTKEPIQ